MRARSPALQGSVGLKGVTETQDITSRGPELGYEAATLSKWCSIHQDTGARLNVVGSSFCHISGITEVMTGV